MRNTRREKPLVRCTHPHFCYEWDSMFITPLMPEFKCCTCECDGEGPSKISDFVKLDKFEEKCMQEWIDWKKKNEQK